MKKMIILLTCLLFVYHATAFAEVKKTILENSIRLELKPDYCEITGTRKSFALYLARYGYFGSSFKITPTETSHDLALYLREPDSKKSAATDITISLQSLPRIITYTKGIEKIQPFKIKYISNDHVNFNVDNAALQPLANAEKIDIILTLKDGTTQKIELPEKQLQDLKYIITCDLTKEYITSR